MPWLRTLLGASAGLAIASGLAAHILPSPDLPHIVREKIAHLSEHGDEYDAIFLGSSRIQNHVIPALFDRIVAETGTPIRSFNFGISAMHPPEDDYVLDLILAQPHARLRWVFVEIDFLETSVQADESGTLRGLYWHDWPRLAVLCHRLGVSRQKGMRRNIRDAFERAHDFLDHLQLFCGRSANVGRGAQALDRWLDRTPPAPMDWNSLGPDHDGWLPAIPKEENIIDKQSGRLGSFLRERILDPPRKDESDRTSQKILAAFLNKIVQAGATPVIVIPPRTRQSYYYPGSEIAARFPIIELCDPARFPELYQEEFRVDRSHFDKDGARIFTRMMAEQFIAATRHP